MPHSALIRTFTGRTLDLLAPEPEAIAIEDIAHGLAHTCRFSGQCARFYSVAEHAVRVSQMVPAEHALIGLLHDASEAYLSDLVSPLKVLRDLSGYRAIEAALMDVILRRFCPGWPAQAGPRDPGAPPGLPESVERADHELVELEMAVLFDGLDIVNLDYHAPVVAERLFLFRFKYLSLRMRATPAPANQGETFGAIVYLERIQRELTQLRNALGLPPAGDHGCGA